MSMMTMCGSSAAAEVDPISGNVVLTNSNFMSAEEVSGSPTEREVYLAFNDVGQAQSAVRLLGGLPLATDYNATDWWLLKPEADIGDDFEIFTSADTTNQGGGTLTGSFDSWNSFPVTFDLKYTSVTESESEVILTVSIRDIATQTLQDTATFTLTCAYFL